MSRDLQFETMQLYRNLSAEREDWRGKLVLLSGAGCAATGAPPAVSIAGGTSLALDSDAAAMKAALRAGWLDFVVNSLDEALRALKNEVRQKRPLSVGLIADIDTTLGEMEERGVQPDMHLVPAGSADLASGPDEHFFPVANITALRAIDAALLGILSEGDLVRRRWLQYAPQFLREARTGGRWIWFSDAELASLAAQGVSPGPHP